jgi:hypothetical protein
MAIGVKVEANFGRLQALLTNAEKQVRFATAVALTKTAKIAEGDVTQAMQQVFDRPTRWALRATRVIPATKQRLIAQLWLKDRRGLPQGKDSNFLVPQVFGGPRGRKAYETRLMQVGWLRSNEFTVPSRDLPLDSNGNVPVGVIRSILSQAKAAGGLGFNSNASNSQRSRRTVQRAGTYFVSRGQSTGNPLPRGIYQRVRMGSGWGTRLVLLIVQGKPMFKQRLRLGQIADRAVDRHFQQQFDQAYANALRTAR